jgi:protein-disulfide isomerase
MPSLRYVTLAISALASCLSAQQPVCMQVAADKQKALSEYVRTKYRVPDSVSLAVASDNLISGTCFHELTFQGVGTLKKWELKLYLSPDQRYLTSDLYDTRVNPIDEERWKLTALMAGLSENKGTSRGAVHSPVTIVEFSDFQCPYCRKCADILDQVLAEEKDNVRVVFHHMPLSIHPWARVAAEGAACAQLQGSKAFWEMHDHIFRAQDEITADNAKAKLAEFARAAKNLDFADFQNCLDNDLSLGLVFRDMNLASSNNVNATPTLFINGHTMQGVKDAAQLRELIAEAAKELTLAAETPPRSPNP